MKVGRCWWWCRCLDGSEAEGHFGGGGGEGET